MKHSAITHRATTAFLVLFLLTGLAATSLAQGYVPNEDTATDRRDATFGTDDENIAIGVDPESGALVIRRKAPPFQPEAGTSGAAPALGPVYVVPDVDWSLGEPDPVIVVDPAPDE